MTNTAPVRPVARIRAKIAAKERCLPTPLDDPTPDQTRILAHLARLRGELEAAERAENLTGRTR